MDPQLNEHSMRAGIEKGTQVWASRSVRWVLIGENPANTAIPEGLALLIDTAIAFNRERLGMQAKRQKRDGVNVSLDK